MKKHLLIAALASLFGVADAQTQLPPAWNDIANKVQYDSRVRAYITPTRVVWKNDGQISGLENLLQQGNGQTDLTNARICVMRSTKTEHPSVLLDFGRELQGGLQIVTGMPGNQKPIKIRVRFGESVSETMCDIDGKNGASNDHAMRDFTMQLPWLGVSEAGNSGFRFVRIDLLDDDRELHLKEVRAIFNYRDIPYLGSFRCNDERLNKIWMTGAYTVHLNMQEYLWDGIKRDRLVWVGDLHPEVMTVGSVFGYNEVVPKSLDLARNTTALPNWMSGISSYSLWWILIQRDWYLHNGDKEYLEQQRDYLSGLLKHLFTKISPDGREQLDGNRFLDWPSSENQQGVSAGLQALMVMAMDAGAELCAELGDKELSKQCIDKATLLRRHVPHHNNSKQGAALLALSGLTDAAKADREVLSVGGSKNFSTFYGYYMLRAMAKAGNHRGALERIREYWGAMLDLGATTFWEDFNLDWTENAARIDEIVPEGKKDIHGDFGAYCYKKFRHSLSHGWASGPTAWLSENVLGVKILAPGCRKVKIEPHLGDLQWVEGTFPTPHGVIKIRHEKRPDGKIKSTVKAPKGVKIIK